MRSLRQLREARGVSQVDLARRIGRSQSFISEAEGGQRRLDLIQLHDICRALEVPLPRLVSDWYRSLTSPGPSRRRDE